MEGKYSEEAGRRSCASSPACADVVIGHAAPGFPPLSGPSLEKYVYGRSEYEMLSPVLTCEST